MNFLKRTVFTATCCLSICFLSIQLTAQKAEFGIRFMPTITSFDIQSEDGGKISGEATVGFGAGVILGFNFTDHLGIQGEVIYNTLTQQYREQDFDRRIKLKYVNIPMLLSYNTGKTNAVNLNIVAGPQLGLSVGSELFTEDGDDPDDLAVLSVKKGDLGVAYGAGLDFGLSSSGAVRLGLGFRGVFGLFDISDDSNSTSTNNYYVLDRTHLKTYSAYAGLSILF
jgi:hypothetical protein